MFAIRGNRYWLEFFPYFWNSNEGPNQKPKMLSIPSCLAQRCSRVTLIRVRPFSTNWLIKWQAIPTSWAARGGSFHSPKPRRVTPKSEVPEEGEDSIWFPSQMLLSCRTYLRVWPVAANKRQCQVTVLRKAFWEQRKKQSYLCATFKV